MRGIPHFEKLFIARDFNGHIGLANGGFEGVRGGFGFVVRNKGASLLDFVKDLS